MPTTIRPNWDLGDEQYVASAIFALVAVAALIYMIRVAREEKKLYPYFLFAGCGAAVVYEPINNVLGLCTYPEVNQAVWISLIGRDIPVYVGIAYFFCFAVPTLWIMRRIRAGVSRRQWWTCYAVVALLFTCFEPYFIHRGWWTYYGDQQPLKVLGFPMWWWFVNSYSVFGMATLLTELEKRGITTGKRSWLYIPLYPIGLFAVHGSVGLPVFLALNSSDSKAVTTVGALLTIGLALAGIQILATFATREKKPGTEASSDHAGVGAAR